MLAHELRRRFIDFFVKRHYHAEIPSASLIPENDPTVLFTTAGMHPLVPYLMGEKHPLGKRLVDCQKSLRTDDIEEVGDNTHLTFFEMLGNWSLGDYFKEGAISMSYDFLTSDEKNHGIHLNPDRLMITCFAGDSDAPRDEEASRIWESFGFKCHDKSTRGQKKLIYFYEKKKNWWGPAGKTGPCGPDTEMFYDTCPDISSNEHNPSSDKMSRTKYILQDFPDDCHPNCECGRFVEIWNDVFMQYNKKADGSYEPLKQQNVDTGLGLERVSAILQGKESVFDTELFKSVIEAIQELSTNKTDLHETKKSTRIITDHLRSATFVLGDEKGISPSNTDQGYIVRRLIRRSIRHGKKIGIKKAFTHLLAKEFIGLYSSIYPELKKNHDFIIEQMTREEEQFNRTLSHGEKEFEKMRTELEKTNKNKIEGRQVFKLYDTFGFPIEMTKELAKENNLSVDEAGFDSAYKKHQETSRKGAEKKFSGGLADHSEETTKLHTATHLLQAALRSVLGTHVFQRGSNITAERLRFDFSHGEKMTPEQIREVENLVNSVITADLPLHCEEMTVNSAKEYGAIGIFEEKYGEKVKVYTIGKSKTDYFSKEICGGPHVEHTGLLKSFKIIKESAISQGVRRIKAVISG